MTREEALEELATPSYDAETIGQEIEFVANKLEMTVDELNACMTMPRKTFHEYKNQQEIYMLGARVMRAFGLELGGKR